MEKILIFFTTNYPYGQGESFIENEIAYLSASFQSIYLISSNIKDEQTRVVPDNVILVRKANKLNFIEKTRVLFYSHSRIILKEVVSLLKKKEFSFSRFKYILSSYSIGRKIFRDIDSIIINNNYSRKDIVLYSYWWLDESIGIALYKNTHPSVKAVSRAHGYDLYHYRQPSSFLPFRRFTIQVFDKLFTISQNGKTYLKEYYNLTEQEFEKIELSRLGTVGQNIREKTVKSDIFTIVSCSFIYPNKRVHLIAETLLLMKEKKIRWIHIGDYANWVGSDYKKMVENSFELLKSNPQIDFEFMGNISNIEILKLYQNQNPDLFINVSTYEGIPVSIMEAMSFGIPAIATNVGGTSEIVSQDNGCLLSEDLTVDMLLNKINEMIDLNFNEQMKKRQSAFNTWNNNYNAQINYTNFVNKLINL